MYKRQLEDALDPAEVSGRFSLEGEGRLLWDLEAGRLHSFELRGETRLDVTQIERWGDPGTGGQRGRESRIRMAGTTLLTARAGAP